MIQIETYQELNRFVVGFRDGGAELMIICSRGAMGKSQEALQVLPQEDAAFVCHQSPLGLYGTLYRERDKMIVFEEVDGLLADSKTVGLLKQVCETRTPKTIMWGSTCQQVQDIDGGVGHFQTNSRVLMLCNSFGIFNSNVAALTTRGVTLQFLPSNVEILGKIKTFASDSEIVAFLEEFHEAIPDFSLRTYRILEGLKRVGIDWRKYCLEEAKPSPKVQEIAGLLVRLNSDKERIKHYSGSRRDYYYWKPEAVEYVRRQTVKAATCGPRPHEVPDGQSASSAGNGHADAKGSPPET